MTRTSAADASAADALAAALAAALRGAIREAVAAELAGRPATNAPDKLLNVDEAAGRLGIGRSRLYDELAAGRLASLRVGRRRLVSEGQLAEYIRQAEADS